MKYKVELSFEEKTYLVEDEKGHEYSVVETHNINCGFTGIEIVDLNSDKSPKESVKDEIMKAFNKFEEKKK